MTRASAEPRAVQIGVAAAAALALAAALWLEIGYQTRDPFWLDEAWTGAIVGQKRFADFFHQARLDVNAPLYYLLLHGWQRLFGLSDLALRVPSLIFATVTPVLVALRPPRGLSLDERFTWAGLLAVWTPGLSFAEEARSYALLLLLSTAQSLALVALMNRPDLRRAALWAGLASLAVVTHYEAVVLGGVQGLIYLAVHRKAALRTWPAALLFVPAFGWLGFHAPRIAEFARPGVAWYRPLRLADLPDSVAFLAGSDLLLRLLLGSAVACGVLWAIFRPRVAPRAEPSGLWVIPVSAAVGAGVVLAIGLLRPSFIHRYLTPFAPGVLLAVVLMLRAVPGRVRGAAQGLLLAAFLLNGAQLIRAGFRQSPKLYSFEAASQYLTDQGVRRVAFLWDHPANQILTPEQVRAFGGFFFDRAGAPVALEPLILPFAADPNPVIRARLQAPGSGVIWLFDRKVRVRPAPAVADPAIRCRDFGRGAIAVLACDRPAGA